MKLVWDKVIIDWYYQQIVGTHIYSSHTVLHDITYDIALVSCLELGLRWLNDRIEDDHRDQFGAFIKGAFPSIMTGIAHGLILDAQQKIADEFKADPDSMRKLRNKHRELTKRRKKNIP